MRVYIALNMKNNYDYPVNATLTYEGITSTGEQLSGVFNFLIKPEKQFNKYLIRASSQYNWNIIEINSISIQTNAPIIIENVNILEGD